MSGRHHSERPARSPAALALLLVAAVGACSFGSKTSSGGNGGGTGAYPTGNGTGSAGTNASTGSAGTGYDSGSGTAGTNIGPETGSAGVGSIMTGGGGSGGTFLFDAGTTDALPGTDGGSAGGGGISGSAGTSGSAGSGVPGCIVSLTPVMPPSLNDIEAGTTLQLHASVSGFPGLPDGGALQWTWAVSTTGASSLARLDYTPIDDDASTIEVVLATPGMYQVQVKILGVPSCDRAPLTFTVKAAQTPSFRFRVTPPSGTQLPIREVVAQASAIANGAQTIALGDGKSTDVVSFFPVDDVRGFPIPSYLRITSPSFTFDVEGYTGQSALIAPLATGLTYDLLIVPDGDVAPLFVSGTTDDLANKMSLVAGASVTGTTRDGSGRPVVGARVLLQAGDRPSTLGVSDGTGAFTLSTRDGSLSADIQPPDGVGLPEAHVTVSPGIVLLPGMTSLDLAMDWAPIPSGTLTVNVSGPVAASPRIPGARVRAVLAATLSNVGTVSVHGATATQLTATGTVGVDTVSDMNGIARFGPLPTGKYHVTISPPPESGGAITVTDVDVPAAGAEINVPVAALVEMTGRLVGAAAFTGVVTAIDRGPLPSPTVPTMTLGSLSGGKFAMQVSMGRTYEIVADPDPALGLPRFIVDVLTVNEGPGRDYTVPATLVWSGTVTGGGHGVGGALVQVFCAAPSATCLDPTLPLATGTTAADGTLTLALPAP
jgi:hypothetical protein